MARLKVKYTEEIAPALMKKFQYKSVMQIPQIAKVIVNVASFFFGAASFQRLLSDIPIVSRSSGKSVTDL